MMEKQKLCGSTNDRAETVVDYKNQKIEIKGVPEENLYNRLKSAFCDWLPYIIGVWALLVAIFMLFHFISFVKDSYFTIPTYICSGMLAFLLICHINKKFDSCVRKWFAVRTGNKKRNKAKFTNIKTNELVLYNIENIVLEYETAGDVKKQLNKIWIKEEHPSSILTKQANMEGMLLLDNDPVWNAHFMFENTPKDGYLYVEWI